MRRGSPFKEFQGAEKDVRFDEKNNWLKKGKIILLKSAFKQLETSESLLQKLQNDFSIQLYSF